MVYRKKVIDFYFVHRNLVIVIERVYTRILTDHFLNEKNMAFMAGPRQSGKTTTAEFYKPGQTSYWNWDDADDRPLLRGSPARFKEQLAKRDPQHPSVLVLDELHKNKKWKRWLKGFYDKQRRQYEIIVTGSARLNVFRRGGDSLLGRYYLYRHHPLSLGEIGKGKWESALFRDPSKTSSSAFQALYRFGGFPAPFLAAREASHNKWLKMRTELLVREDLRDLSKIEDLAAVELLAELLKTRAGGLLNHQNLANDLDVSVDTVRRWIKMLENLYYLYLVPPYSANIKRALKKMPKVFLWDWSAIEEKGGRFENMMASHLLKSVHYWTDCGLGNFELYYVRDKQKREVDFLVTKNKKPFLLTEAKVSEENIHPPLAHYSAILKPDFSFQVVMDKPPQKKGIAESKPLDILAAQDFLGSLV